MESQKKRTIHINDENHSKLLQIKYEMAVDMESLVNFAVDRLHKEYEDGLITAQDFQNKSKGNDDE